MKLIGATASDVGNVREANQDRAFFRGAVAALADGMGGHQGGERAAELAIGEFEENRRYLAEGDLVEIMISANRHVHGHAGDHGLPGMGTTLVALTLHHDETITVANVGDSRAYWLRTGHMSQITEDHSFVEDLVRQGRLTPEEAAVHPQRNILTRAVGIGSEVEVDRFPIDKPLVGDRFLLCSDGLFNEVTEDEILEILMATDEPQEAADALVAAALATPCRDNVTVTVVDVVDDDDERVVPIEDYDEVEDPIDPDKTTTAPMPVVSKSVVKDLEVGENGQKPKPIPPERKSARGAGTLVLDEHDVDHRDPPSILEGQEDTLDVGGAYEDPELFEETTELEIVDAPDEVGTRKSMMAAIIGGVVMVAALAGGYLGLRAYAGSSYFIADENEQLVIFQGRRGGFLWFDPQNVGQVDVSLSDLSDAEVATIQQREFDSKAEADELATSLQQRQQAEEQQNQSESEADSLETDPNAATDGAGAGSESRTGGADGSGGEADEVDVTDAVTDDSTAPNNEG